MEMKEGVILKYRKNNNIFILTRLERPEYNRNNGILMSYENVNFYCSLKSLTYIIKECNLFRFREYHCFLEEVYILLVMDTVLKGGDGYWEKLYKELVLSYKGIVGNYGRYSWQNNLRGIPRYLFKDVNEGTLCFPEKVRDHEMFILL